MFPTDIEIYNSTKSEKEFFYALKNQLPERILVFYSVRWYTENIGGSRENSESDFLIYDPHFGFITIEVKGGTDIYKNGNEWVLKLEKGIERKLRRSPLEQARESMNFFYDYFQQQYGFPFNGVFGFCAAFPFYNISGNLGVDFPKHLIIDFSDMKGLNEKINEIFHYWASTRKKHLLIVQETTEKFLNMINRRISLAMVSGALLEHQERVSKVLNRVQDSYLDFIENYKEAFIIGSAGTGKTWLALKKAQRIAEQEKRVLLLCYNQKLAEFLKKSCSHYENIDCMTFGQLAASLISHQDFQLIARHRDLPGVFSYLKNITFLPKYDAVIIDEAQDFTEEWALSSKLFLKKSSESIYYIFFDSEQNIFKRDFNHGFNIDNPPFVLRENLRNTSAIVKWIKENTLFAKNTRSNTIPGVIPEVVTFNRKVDAKMRLEYLIKNLVEKELVPIQSIIILSDRRLENSLLAGNTLIGQYNIAYEQDLNNEHSIRFYTTQSFKGLESDVVIYLSHRSSTHLEKKTPLDYVAYTRAKYFLCVIEFII